MRKILTAIVAAAAFTIVGTTAAQAADVNPATSGRDSSIPNTEGAVTAWHLKNGTVGQSDMYPAVNQAYLETYYNTVGDLQLKQEIRDLLHPFQAGTIGGPVTVKNTGGSVFAADAATELAISDVTVQPGKTYLIQYSAQVDATAAADVSVPVVRPQIMPWLNRNADATFDADEAVPGAVSANAVLPTVINRHVTMSGSVVYTHPADEPAVALQLGAHAYADNGSDAREGDVRVMTATLSATLIG